MTVKRMSSTIFTDDRLALKRKMTKRSMHHTQLIFLES
jgi:hypothetical protein